MAIIYETPNGAYIDEWTPAISLSVDDEDCQFNGLNSNYAYDPYCECADGVEPPKLINTIVNPSSGDESSNVITMTEGTGKLKVMFSKVESAQLPCKICLKIIKR